MASQMVGVMSAMPEEIDLLIAEMGSEAETISRGMRTYHQGVLWGTPVTLVFSRWGKVSAATTSTHLISEFDVEEIIFSGVSATDPVLRIGDVVVAKDLYQHDMDARPLFERHEIPLLKMSAFPSDERSRNELVSAARSFLNAELGSVIEASGLRTKFRITDPKVVVADIASGDEIFCQRGGR